MQFIDLKAQYQAYKAEIDSAVAEVMSSAQFIQGTALHEFERELSAYIGIKHAIGCASGTDALLLAMMALGVQPGDEVLVPDFTFIATAEMVAFIGAVPVFVDVDEKTYNMDPSDLKRKITAKSKGVIPVSLYGQCADYDEINVLAASRGLWVMEDAAQSFGSTWQGRRIGAIGDFVSFSFHPNKNVTTIEGGMIITNSEKSAEVLRSLRNHGMVGKFTFERIGFSAKMNELEAAVGLGNIDIFHDILEKRRRNMLYLIDKFRKFDAFFITLKEETYEKLGPHAFSIILRPGLRFTKDEFVAWLDEKGVDSRNLFYSMPTQCPSYAFLGHKLGEFPEAEYCSDYGTHIGIHQDVEQDQLDYVIEVVEEFLRSKKMISA